VEKTKAQRIMAKLLRENGIKIEENKIVSGGEADILLPDYKVVIELDGYFHLSLQSQKRDQQKERYWIENGYQVFRFRNDEIYTNKERCLKTIVDHIHVMEGIATEQIGTPLKDQDALKLMHRRLLNQEEKIKHKGKMINPRKNPEAFFLSLDKCRDAENDDAHD
jgi:very-short-patch-repair endonuclease